MSHDRPFLMAETPRGGRWNSCLIVAEGSGIDPVTAAPYLEAARGGALGDDYLAVSREVTQPTTGRVGRETLVLAGVAVRKLGARRRAEVEKAMQGLLLKDLDELIRADPWRDRPQASLIEHPAMSDWAEAFRDLPRSGPCPPDDRRRRGSPRGTRLEAVPAILGICAVITLLLGVVLVVGVGTLRSPKVSPDAANPGRAMPDSGASPPSPGNPAPKTFDNKDLLKAFDALKIAPPGDPGDGQSSLEYARILLQELDEVLKEWLVLERNREAYPSDSEEGLRKLLNDFARCTTESGATGQTPPDRELGVLLRDPLLLRKIRQLGPTHGSPDRDCSILGKDRREGVEALLAGRDVGRFREVAREVCRVGQAVKALGPETARAGSRPLSDGPGGSTARAPDGQGTRPKPDLPGRPGGAAEQGNRIATCRRSAEACWNFFIPDDLKTMRFIQQLNPDLHD